MAYMVMGVSGSGKSTVGKLLAQQLQLHFIDADDHHLAPSIDKMSRGIPLTDADRMEWLQKLNHLLKEAEKNGQTVVMACSALKESYRLMLQKGLQEPLKIIYLHGDEALLQKRLAAREGHFMPKQLLASQIQTLEIPPEALSISIELSPDQLVQQIIQHFTPMDTSEKSSSQVKAGLGLVGMGVMGKSLALNLASKGETVAVFNRTVAGLEERVAEQFARENPDQPLLPFSDVALFVQALAKPRKILLMVKAGPAVDALVEQLLPFLEAGDVVMDGGNSHYEDTKRRTHYLQEKNLYFLGVGISGGEEGALKGPSLMPGGPREGYDLVADMLEKMAAKDKNGQACCTYMGPEGAGHFVKMVHNGIEYAEMQALAEVYQLMRFHLNFSPEAIADELENWQTQGLDSYLLEITIHILRKKEEGTLVLDTILDAAGQKGTGGWSTTAALDVGVALDSIAASVMARYISAQKDNRVKAAEMYGLEPAQLEGVPLLRVQQLRQAYEGVRLVNHGQGFALLQAASEQFNWQLNLSEIARIWTNGCIIRSALMEELAVTFRTEPDLLLHQGTVEKLKSLIPSWTELVGAALQANAAVPVFSASLNYVLGYSTAQSPANLIQAQRDYFGAHTFRKIDAPADQYFHVAW